MFVFKKTDCNWVIVLGTYHNIGLFISPKPYVINSNLCFLSISYYSILSCKSCRVAFVLLFVSLLSFQSNMLQPSQITACLEISCIFSHECLLKL